MINESNEEDNSSKVASEPTFLNRIDLVLHADNISKVVF
jgi:hypothetical protein